MKKSKAAIASITKQSAYYAGEEWFPHGKWGTLQHLETLLQGCADA